MFTLSALEHQEITCRWRLHPGRPSLLIGRSPLADVWLMSPSVSRHHARLERSDEGAWTITDLNTTNGVHVNGVRTTRSILADGDLLQCGSIDLRVDALPPLASASAGIEALRDRINRGPSASNWAAICATLEAWTDDTLDVGLDYVRDHTARWPLTLCRAPESWLNTLLLGLRQALSAARRAARSEPSTPTPLMSEIHKPENPPSEISEPGSPDPRSPEPGRLKARPLPPFLLGPEDPRWIAARSLLISAAPADESVRDALAQSPRLDQVEHVALRSVGNGRAFVKALSQGPHRPALKSLDLTACGLLAGEVEALVQSPALGAVSELILDGNRLGRAGVLSVAQAMGRFERLSMRSAGLDDLSANALAEALIASPLKSLDVGWNAISGDALNALQRAFDGDLWSGAMGLDSTLRPLPPLPADPRLFKKALKKARLRHGADLVALLTLAPVDGSTPVAYPLRDDSDLVIGRTQEADIVIPRISVSRRHARVAVRRDDQGEVVIKCGDFESTSGLWSEEGLRFSLDRLRPGERLRLGDVWLSVKPVDTRAAIVPLLSDLSS